MSWLAKLLPKRGVVAADALRDEGLALAMDWGDQWLSPIQARLRERHRSLSPAELDAINGDCQGAMRLGHETVHALVREGAAALAPESLGAVVRAQYPWISDENVHRLFQQSLYYAAKTGGPARSR